MAAINYQCLVCTTIFTSKQSYLVHRLKCAEKHNKKPAYKLLKITLFDSLNLAIKERDAMPNRFQSNNRAWIYKYIAVRDGEKCLLCGAGPGREPLEIDHADANPYNEAPDNLHLLCKACNLGLRKVTPKEHARIISIHSATNVSERECVIGNPATELAQGHIDYSDGPAPMRAAGVFEVKVRQFVLEEVGRVGSIPKQDLICSAAEVAGCSPISAERYLSKLVSSAGALQITRGPLNELMVSKRPALPARPLSKLVEKQLNQIIK